MTTVKYKGATLTTVDNVTKTLTTSGTYLEDDITLTDSGGGSGVGTLLGTLSLGALSTTSSSPTTIDNKTLTISGVNEYDFVIAEMSVDSVVNDSHLATVNFVLLTASSNISTKNGSTIMSYKWNAKNSSSGVITTRTSATGYGVSLNTATITNGTLSMTFYVRYNATQTGTINGNYTARAYGVKLADLIGG